MWGRTRWPSERFEEAGERLRCPGLRGSLRAEWVRGMGAHGELWDRGKDRRGVLHREDEQHACGAMAVGQQVPPHGTSAALGRADNGQEHYKSSNRAEVLVRLHRLQR